MRQAQREASQVRSRAAAGVIDRPRRGVTASPAVSVSRVARTPSRAHERENDARDAIVLFSIVVVGLGIAAATSCAWVITNFLVLGAPLAWLWITSPTVRARVGVKFSLLLVLFGTLTFDSLARRTAAWGGESVLPFLLPGQVSVEEFQWILLYFPLVLAINERFFAGDDSRSEGPLPEIVLKLAFCAGIAFACLPQAPAIIGDYSYLKIGLALYVPAIVTAIWLRPAVMKELAAVMVVTTLLHLPFEVIALRENYWTFPGRYVGEVEMAGVRFPVEELLFLVFFSGPSLIAAHSMYKGARRTEPARVAGTTTDGGA